MKQTAQFFAKESPQTARAPLHMPVPLRQASKPKTQVLIKQAWESFEMDAELQDAYATQYGSVIKSSSPERLREMLAAEF